MSRIFDGPAYDPGRDNQRLAIQIVRVWNVMIDGEWHTHGEVSEITGDPQPSVLAQFGHMRKRRFGGHTVERRAVGRRGLYEYRLIPNGPLLDGTDRTLDPPSVICPACGSGRLRPREDAVITAARELIRTWKPEQARELIRRVRELDC